MKANTKNYGSELKSIREAISDLTNIVFEIKTELGVVTKKVDDVNTAFDELFNS